MRDTISYPEVKAAKSEHEVSYSAMMVDILLRRFELDHMSLKLCISLAHKPKRGILNNITFIFIDYEPGMTPKAIERALEAKAWEAPVVSAVLHNLDTLTENNSSFADVLISLVPGQQESESKLFNSAYVWCWNTTVPLYCCCVRYGDHISVAVSFNHSVMKQQAENADRAARGDSVDPDVRGVLEQPPGEAARKVPKRGLRSLLNTITCSMWPSPHDGE